MHVALIDFRTTTPYAVQLANALGQLCKVTLMLPDKSPRLVNQVDRNKIEFWPFQKPRIRHLTNMRLIWHIRQHLDAIQPDLVHISYWDVWGSPGLRLFSPFPHVATVHDAVPHPGDSNSFPTFLYPLQWLGAEQVIVHANSVRQKLLAQQGCSQSQINVIPIGQYDFYQTWAQKDLPEIPNTVLFFGRIWGYKGLQYLIDAEPLITKAVPDARIIIAGTGASFEKYRRAMVNPQHFEVHNYRIPDEKVAQFFQQASIVALPYIEASQSGIVPLAFAFGKPVVATRIGGLVDIVKDGQTGLLVPPADSQSLAEAIISLLKDPSRRQKMGQRAKQFADTELSWKAIARKTVDVYQKVMLNGNEQ